MWDLFLSIIGKADAYLARFIIPYRYPPLRSDLAISDFQFLSTQLPPLDRYPEQILALVLSFALTFVYNPSSGKGKILFQSIVWAVVLSASTLFRWAKNSIIYFHSKALPTRQIESRKVRSDHMKDEIFKLKTSDYSPYPDKVLNLREYRCLLLKSAKNEDEVIVCELFHITNSMATPYYEALSYAWGTKLASRFILVDGKRLSVTENLFSALHHLRRNYRHRLLWVDAICIDQSNLKEQSQQVRIMDKIYQNAANVIVWLGPSTPESRLALRYIGFRMQLSHLPRIIEKFVAMKLLFKISQRRHSDIILGLLNSPWFSRIWTVQEVAISKLGHCTIQCGEETMKYDFATFQLYELVSLLSINYEFPLNELLYTNSRQIFRVVMRSRTLFKKPEVGEPLIVIMRSLCSFEATDQRDKIFGLYGILRELGIQMPTPDYKDCLDDVYWQGTVSIVSQDRSLRFLSMASGADSRISKAPSWVPDYRKIPTLMNMDKKWEAYKDAPGKFIIFNDNKYLKVYGTIMDEIIDHSHLRTWEPPFDVATVQDGPRFGLDQYEMFCPTIKALRDWLDFATSEDDNVMQRYGRSYSAFEMLMTQSFADLARTDHEGFRRWTGILRSYKSKRKWDGIETLNETLERILNKQDIRRRLDRDPHWRHLTTFEEWRILFAMKIDLKASRSMHLAWTISRGNTIFKTGNGYLGLASHCLVKEDLVALIQGVRTPMVLRAIPTLGEKHFKVIGPAYVHGMMHGECFVDAERKKDGLILV